MPRTNDILKSFFHGGITSQEEALIHDTRTSFNFNMLRAVSTLATCIPLCLLILSLFSQEMQAFQPFYAICVVPSCIIMLFCFLAPEGPRSKWFTFMAALQLVVAMVFGIALGTYGSLDQASVTFVCFLIVVPLLFAARPCYSALITVISCAVFIALASSLKPHDVFVTDAINACCFTVIGILVGTVQVSNRLQCFVMTERVSHLSVTDALTGAKNRRAFEDELNQLAANEPQEAYDVTLVSIDLNGLKWANDHLLHEAGDEMLVACVKCLREAFGADANIYRVGGDEFAVISLEPLERIEENVANLRQITAAWKGELSNRLALAIGVKSLSQCPHKTMSELRKLADSEMYIDKARYYENTGFDRRRAR